MNAADKKNDTELEMLIDGRLGENERRELLARIARERGLFLRFVRAGKATYSKHVELPTGELEDLKSIVKGGLGGNKPLLLAAAAAAAALLAVIVVVIASSGSTGLETAASTGASMTGGKSTGRRTSTGRRPVRTGAGRTGRNTSETLPSRTGKAVDVKKIRLQRISGDSERKKVAELIKKNPDELFQMLRSAGISGKALEAKMILEAFAVLGDDGLGTLIEVISGNFSPDEKLGALSAVELALKWSSVSETGQKRLYKVIKDFFGGSDGYEVKKTALSVLGRINLRGDEYDRMPVYVAALRDPEELVRAEAVKYIAASGGGKAADELKRVLQDERSPKVRAQAIVKLKSLAEFDPVFLQQVREGMGDSSSFVRFAAADYCIARASKLAIEQDRDELVAEALETLGAVASGAVSGEGRINTPISKTVTTDNVSESEDVALRAVELAVRTMTKDPADFLVNAAAASSTAVRRYAILELIRDKNIDAVSRAVNEIKSSGEKEGAPFVAGTVTALRNAFGGDLKVGADAPPGEAADEIERWWSIRKTELENRPEDDDPDNREKQEE